MYKIGSELQRATLAELRPTQMTVGYRAVASKRRELTKASAQSRYSAHVFPAVKGPGKGLYILDGHHTALALLRNQVVSVEIGLVCELSQLSELDFWTYLDHRAWMHCYDGDGTRREFSDMPICLEDLQDDPFRSLAAAVLALGGFSKPEEPFYEFIWANHFRRHFDLADLQNGRFQKTAKKASLLARKDKSKFMPGWAGES